MDSTRFPQKVIQPIVGKSLLWYVIERSKFINIPIIIATTERSMDDPIVKIAKECKVEYFRGSYEDVLDRYYQTAKKYSLNQIFRISADTPLIDPKFCSKMVKTLENGNMDYVRFGYNTVGIGMEGFRFEALEKAWLNAKLPQEREHVTMYIKNHPMDFKLHVIESDYNLVTKYWTVEHPEDLEFVKRIFEEFSNKDIFYTEDILKLLKRKPELTKKT